MITAAEAKKLADKYNGSFRYDEEILRRIKISAERGYYDYCYRSRLDEPSIRGLCILGFKVIDQGSSPHVGHLGYLISWKGANVEE